MLRTWQDDPKKLLAFRLSRLYFGEFAELPESLGNGKIERTSSCVYTVLRPQKPTFTVTVGRKTSPLQCADLIVKRLSAGGKS